MKLIVEEKKYGEKIILENVNLDFKKGEVTCIVGESGCGKSTLLNILSGFDKDFLGYCDKNSTSYITQDCSLLERYSVRENLAFISKENFDEKKFNSYVNVLGLMDMVDKRVNKLSGGQRQRVCILRGILLDVDYILLDEPTSSLDIDNIHTLMKLLQDIAVNSQVGIIISTHEHAVINYSENVIMYTAKSFSYIKQSSVSKDGAIDKNIHKNKLNTQFIRYFIRYFTSKIIYLFSLLVVILVLISCVNSFKNYLSSDYDTIVNSLSDDMIGIQKLNYDKNCGKESCLGEQKFDDLKFSNEEIEKFENTKEIKSVEGLYLPQELTKTDSSGNKLYLDIPSEYYSKNLKYLEQVRRNLISKKDDIDYLDVPTDYLKYRFRGVPVSQNYIKTYGYLSDYYLLSNILYGNNNFENENDIIVPENLAIYYCDINDISIEELINQEVKIPLEDSTFGTYRVIGVYDDKLVKTFPDLGNVYVKNNPITTSSKLYEVYKETFSSVKEFNYLYPTEESFIDKNETADNVVILTVDPDFIDKVYDKLVELYPNAIVFDKNSYVSEHYKQDKFNKDVSMKITLLLSFITLVVSMIFNHRLFMRSNINDIKVFRELDYRKESIVRFYYVYSTMYALIICFVLILLNRSIYMIPIGLAQVIMLLINKNRL